MDRRDVIRSRTNPLVRRFRAQKDHDGLGLALLEGWRLLEKALSAGIAVEEAALSGIEPRGHKAKLLAALRERGASVRLVEPNLLDQLSDVETSQGVLALVRRPVFDEAD